MSDSTRKWRGAIVLAALSMSFWPALVTAQEEEWKGMSKLEQSHAYIEKNTTLRIVRFGVDPEGVLEDQGSVIGWSAAAASGTIESRTEPGTTESLEIMRRGEAVGSKAR